MASTGRPGLLAVKGAKYNRRNGDESKEKTIDRLQQIPRGTEFSNFNAAQQQLQQQSNLTNTMQSATSSTIKQSQLNTTTSNVKSSSAVLKNDSSNAKLETDKYWKTPTTSTNGNEDLVIIHVCDENQQISKDFCCKRDILVHHMKYFEKFLAENENGYDDIDISVHCDVEIFEWLMTYIHEPDSPPQIDKSIIVSILISSEFLQMDTLVDLCIAHVSGSLSEIIKLPIDLSCISEKLINRIAYITHPKTLSETRDKKDKILTKLYKRRVELDFSRKGSASKGSFSSGSVRTIAASLTCCRHCGMVYLDNYVGYLNCRNSPPTVNFRGQLASRHSSIVGWSLTSYLKTLHSGGMGWDAIYWHVWAACIVFRVENIMVSTLETDRYTVEQDGLLIRGSVLKEVEGAQQQDGESSAADSTPSSPKPSLPPKAPLAFSLSLEDDCKVGAGSHDMLAFKLMVSRFDDSLLNQNPSITSSLNPHRPPEVLTPEIFDLICSQMKYIVSMNHKQLIQNTMKSIVDSVKVNEGSQRPVNFGELLWGPGLTNDGEELAERRRGRSPTGRTRATSLEPRKQASMMKSRTPHASASVSGRTAASSDLGSDSSDNEARSERRSRSSSMGNRTGQNASSSKLVNKGAKKDSEGSTMGVDLEIQDPFARKQISILLSLPPDVRHKVLNTKGAVFGVWSSTHPLQVISQPYKDILGMISESALSDSKKLEWELDVMREQDEKRMERFERFLVARRNPVVDNFSQFQKAKASAATTPNNANKSSVKGSVGGYFASKAGSSNNDYYKDRGRQTYR